MRLPAICGVVALYSYVSCPADNVGGQEFLIGLVIFALTDEAGRRDFISLVHGHPPEGSGSCSDADPEG